MSDLTKPTRYKRRLLVSALTLLLLLAGQFFLWRFVHQAAMTLQIKRTENQQLANLRARLRAVDEALVSQQPALDSLINVFPLLNFSSQAVEKLEGLAERHGLALTIANIKEEAAITSRGRSDIVPLAFIVKVVGNSDDLLGYLDDIEHGEELVVIKSWLLENSTDQLAASGVPTLQHSLTIDLTFYLQKIRDAQPQ